MKTVMLLAGAALAALATAASARDVIIHAGHLIDGVTKVEQGPSSILIRDDRIVSVVSGYFLSRPPRQRARR